MTNGGDVRQGQKGGWHRAPRVKMRYSSSSPRAPESCLFRPLPPGRACPAQSLFHWPKQHSDRLLDTRPGPANLEGERGSNRGSGVKEERGRTGASPSLLPGPAALGSPPPQGRSCSSWELHPCSAWPRCPGLPAVTRAKRAVPAHTRAF